MKRLKYILLIALVGTLAFLIYVAFNNQKQRISSMDHLLKCINLQECRGKNCAPLPEYCSALEQQKKTQTARNDISLNKLISSIYDRGEKPKIPGENSEKVQSVSEEELRRAIEQRKQAARRPDDSERIRHRESQYSLALKRIDTKYIEVGFNYALGSIFISLSLIAFSMAIATTGFKPVVQTFALMVLATGVAAAFTGETVIKNYNFLGPYLFLLGGASLLLYDEQKELVLPILGVIIGVLIGFTAGADSPVYDKWPFIVGVMCAAGFIIMIFTISIRLFRDTWFKMIMTYLGGGLIAVALVMFALEINGKA